MVMDVINNKTYRGDHCTIHTNIESLHCVSKTNTMLCVHHTVVKTVPVHQHSLSVLSEPGAALQLFLGLILFTLGAWLMQMGEGLERSSLGQL